MQGSGKLPAGAGQGLSKEASEGADNAFEIDEPDTPADQIEFIIQLESEMMKKLFPVREKGKNIAMSEISPKKGSLSAVIRSYKSAVSYSLHKMGLEFAWHGRFYDRIVRNPGELERIRWYIRMNPKNWNNSEKKF
ncbi:MAG: hypothetical protein IPH84_15625 [Bacteroidales bacterium]|nr:hypothetical protein [Bacteroidales bacterium]